MEAASTDQENKNRFHKNDEAKNQKRLKDIKDELYTESIYNIKEQKDRATGFLNTIISFIYLLMTFLHF